MWTDFFIERVQVSSDAGASRFVGTVPEFPEIRVEAATPEACQKLIRDEIARVLTIEALASPPLDEPLLPLEPTPTSAATVAPPLKIHAEDAQYAKTVERNGDPHPEPRRPPESSQLREIIYEKRDGVARLTINRPGYFNAYTSETLGEMSAAFHDAAADRGVGVLVLTGAGDKAFCAGSDIEQHRREHLGQPDEARKWFDLFVAAHEALRKLRKPAIARINGVVAGSGNSWNLACDLAIAADHARFAHIETTFGLISAVGTPQWLPLFIGERRAREIMLIGQPISASKALLWGLVNDVVPAADLDAAVDALCGKLINRFPDSLRQTRDQLNYWLDVAWRAAIEPARESQTAQFGSEEAYEGLAALADKREIDYAAFRAGRSSPASRKAAAQTHAPGPGESGRTPQNGIGEERDCPGCGAAHWPSTFKYCGLCGAGLTNYF